jgi:ApbE superfamily uncharacterized protein (UPF0280 family)
LIQERRLSRERLWLNHGPIDLVIGADGDRGAVARAYRAARVRFEGLLEGLCAELETLRAPLGAVPPEIADPVGRRMLDAAWPHRGEYVTPMAAVAGAVAEAILAAMTAAARLERAYVNDGGDIAIHLAPGRAFEVGLVADVQTGRAEGAITVRHDMPVRGVATSGRDGRSLSLGIADAVTVLAAGAAEADVAATLIANAVDVEHETIERRQACELDADTDLGTLLVTTAVPPLPAELVERALARGAARGREMVGAGLAAGAVVWLQGRYAVVGVPPPGLPTRTRRKLRDEPVLASGVGS